jgi:hypothetical protein
MKNLQKLINQLIKKKVKIKTTFTSENEKI